MNCLTIVGRLTADLEKKNAETTEYVRFCIATNHPSKKDESMFVNCVAFGKQAEFLAKYGKKGDKVALFGKLCLDNVQSQDGVKRTFISVIADRVDLTSNTVKTSSTDEHEDSKVNESFAKTEIKKEEDTSSFDNYDFSTYGSPDDENLPF